MNQLNYIDLFAGAGGMSEGFSNAGFHPISHVEMDKDACFTLKTRITFKYLLSNNKQEIYLKYLKKEISREDLYELIPNELLESVQNKTISNYSLNQIFTKIDSTLKTQKVDLIIGGPPCQAFSLIGRHQKEIEKDPRNKLYLQYGKFLKKYNPTAFVFENVPGILSADNGKHFKNLQKHFKSLGYIVYPELLNASDYGVLQSRKRVIIVGWRNENDLGFPKIEIVPSKFKANDILIDLPKLKPGDALQIANYTRKKNNYLDQHELRNCIDFVTQHISRPHNKRDLAIYKIAIEKWNNENKRLKYIDLPKELKTHKNTTSFLDRFKVVNGNGVSHTVVAHIAKDGHYYIHPDINQCRSISVREAARLQSFPDNFYFEGSRTAAFKQIGNAVPPLMSFAIAKKMKELLCQKK